jgi:trimethylamine--corrinoid protein Co-methyltransferase
MNENFSWRSSQALLEMGAVIRGSEKGFLEKPCACLDVCVVSPLTHDRRQVELLLFAAEYGLPVSINAGAIGGASAPITLAAIATQVNAELLSAIVICYCKKPGAKVLYGSWGRHIDMRTTLVTMGGPEYAMLKTTTAQMGRYYGIPSRGGGVLSDSLVSDAQSGFEKMITTLIPALSRVNYISGMGLNETENCFSPAQLIIDDEIVAMVQRVLLGITVDTNSLAIDTIMEVGPGGQFLDHQHTFDNYRGDFFFPKLSNRGTYADWAKKGGKDIRDRAYEKARDMLAKPMVPAIGQDKADELLKIVGSVQRELEG